MYKIAIIIPTFYYGGSKRSAANISNTLKSKYDTVIIQFDSSANVFETECDLIDIKTPAKKSLPGKLLNIIKRIIRVKHILNLHKINLTISIMDGANIVNYFMPNKVKRIMSCRGFGDLLKLEKRYVKMHRRMNGMLFNSIEMYEYYIRKYPELKEKTFCINNVFNKEFLSKSVSEPIEDQYINFFTNHKCLVSIGRVSKEKGNIHLIRAFDMAKKDLSDLGLVVIGSGPDFKELERVVSESQYREDILLMGFQKNPYKYMARCEALALTSYHEGFPNVIVEALGCGIVPISVNCKSGPNEILNRYFTYDFRIENNYLADFGILTPPIPEENHDKVSKNNAIRFFANAIIELFSNDSLLSNYKNKAYNRFLDFTEEKIAKEYEEMIDYLLNQEN